MPYNYNYLTIKLYIIASNIIGRSNLKIVKQISVDRPFLFFIRDVIDNIMIIAGKVNDLSSMNEEIPVNFNVNV